MAIKLGDAIILIGADTSKLDKDMQKLQKQVRGNADLMAASFKKVGVAMTAAGIAIAAGLGVAIKKAVDFRSAMAEVNTLGVQDLERLAEAVKDVAMEFGVDLVDGANAAYQAISAGVNEAQVPFILAEAAKAATAGISDLTTAIELGTSVSNAFGLQFSEINLVFDQAFVAVKNGVTKFEELAASVGKVAPIMKAAGLSTQEMFAAVSSLTKGGLSTAESVTALKGAINAIIKPSSKARKAAEELGIQFDVATLKSMGLAGFLNHVRDATGGNIETMGRLFGRVEGLAGVLALTGEQADHFQNSLNEMNNTTGQTQEAFDRLVESDPAFAWRQLKQTMAVLAVEIGESLLPALSRVVEILKPIVLWIAEFARSNPQATATITIMTAAFAALLLVLGPLLIVLGSVAQILIALSISGVTVASAMAAIGTAVSMAAGAMSALLALFASPVIAVFLAALFSIRIAFVAIQNEWTNFTKMFAESTRWISELFSTLLVGVLEGQWKPFLQFIANSWTELWKTLGAFTWDVFKQLFGFMFGGQLPGVQAAADGMTNSPGGLTLVGEKGPELIDVPRGSNIHTADETASMLGGGSTFNAPLINIGRVDASNKADVDSLLRQMGNMLENKLGNTGLPQGSFV